MLQHTTNRRKIDPNSQLHAAWSQLHADATGRAQQLMKARRGEILTGVHALAALLKTHASEVYSRSSAARLKMVEFNSDLIDEPDDDHAVNMLDALPPLDQAFYSWEELVVELEGKSQTVAEEIEDRFAFIGGSEAELIRYLSRPDLPANMWRWGLTDEVKAITGVSATPKKDGVRQRKLLMQCSANYWFFGTCVARRAGTTRRGSPLPFARPWRNLGGRQL